MRFENFKLSGEAVIGPFAGQEPHRCARLVQALETFLERGTDLGTVVIESEAAAIYLVPQRSVLRGVPDAAALVLVDAELQEIEFLEVLPEFGGDDSSSWNELVARAAAYLK